MLGGSRRRRTEQPVYAVPHQQRRVAQHQEAHHHYHYQQQQMRQVQMQQQHQQQQQPMMMMHEQLTPASLEQARASIASSSSQQQQQQQHYPPPPLQPAASMQSFGEQHMMDAAMGVQTQLWYDENMTQEEAKMLLNGLPDGAFVLHRSHLLPRCFLLSYRYAQTTRHWILFANEAGVGLKNSPHHYPDLATFVRAYSASHYASSPRELECPLDPLALTRSARSMYESSRTTSRRGRMRGGRSGRGGRHNVSDYDFEETRLRRRRRAPPPRRRVIVEEEEIDEFDEERAAPRGNRTLFEFELISGEQSREGVAFVPKELSVPPPNPVVSERIIKETIVDSSTDSSSDDSSDSEGSSAGAESTTLAPLTSWILVDPPANYVATSIYESDEENAPQPGPAKRAAATASDPRSTAAASRSTRVASIREDLYESDETDEAFSGDSQDDSAFMQALAARRRESLQRRHSGAAGRSLAPPASAAGGTDDIFAGLDSDVERWTAADVHTWLSRGAYAEYADSFYQQDVDGPRLIDLRRSTLPRMGVKAEHVPGLARAIAELRQASDRATSRWSVGNVQALVGGTGAEDMRVSEDVSGDRTIRRHIVEVDEDLDTGERTVLRDEELPPEHQHYERHRQGGGTRTIREIEEGDEVMRAHYGHRGGHRVHIQAPTDETGAEVSPIRAPRRPSVEPTKRRRQSCARAGLDTDVENWTPEQVRQWVQSTPYGQYGDNFYAKHVDGLGLLGTEEEDLPDLGVDADDRIGLIHEITDLKITTPRHLVDPRDWTVYHVQDCLLDNNLQSIAGRFRERRVDGKALLNIEDQLDLNFYGVFGPDKVKHVLQLIDNLRNGRPEDYMPAEEDSVESRGGTVEEEEAVEEVEEEEELQLPANGADWSYRHVHSWLVHNGFADYADDFERNRVSGLNLLMMDEDEVRTFGPSHAKNRQALVDMIMRWQEQHSPARSRATFWSPGRAPDMPEPESPTSKPQTPFNTHRWDSWHVDRFFENIGLQRSDIFNRRLNGEDLLALQRADLGADGLADEATQDLAWRHISRLQDEDAKFRTRAASTSSPSLQRAPSELDRIFAHRRGTVSGDDTINNIEKVRTDRQRQTAAELSQPAAFVSPRSTKISGASHPSMTTESDYPEDSYPSSSEPAADVDEWAVQDVSMWLLQTRMGSHRNAFVRDQIDGQKLLQLRPVDLLSMGLSESEAQSLLKARDALVREQAPKSAAAPAGATHEFQRIRESLRKADSPVNVPSRDSPRTLPPGSSSATAAGEAEEARRLRIARAEEPAWNWWQLEAPSAADALEVLAGKHTGAFVIYPSEEEPGSCVLSYVFLNNIYHELIHQTPPGDIFRQGFHLKKVQNEVFPDLHRLVAHYTNPQPTLKCPLRVSERPDPSLQWPKFSRRHSEKLVHPKATWCHIGTGPVYAEKQLAGTATGSFVVYEADSASEHVFTLSYKCGGKVLHEEIVVSQQHASDEWGGFMLAKQSARSFRSLQDLLVYYEHDGKDLECPLNVSQLHLTREPLAEGEASWAWCQIGANPKAAVHALEGMPDGAFVVHSSGSPQRLQLVYNKDGATLAEDIVVIPGDDKTTPSVYFARRPEQTFPSLHKLLIAHEGFDIDPLAVSLQLPKLSSVPVYKDHFLRPKSMKRDAAKWSWWQLDTPQEDAEAILADKPTGAFVISGLEDETTRWVLTYKFKDTLHREYVDFAPGTKLLRRGYHLEREQNKLFDTLHALVDSYEKSRGCLLCPLRISIRPDTSLKAFSGE